MALVSQSTRSQLWFFLAVLMLCVADSVPAQVTDLYRRVSDPRGIARFDGPDDGPIKGMFFHGFPYWDIDSTDMFGIVARDTGAGVITHIWATDGEIDSLVTLKLYVDGGLVLVGSYPTFFKKAHGCLRAPFDSVGNGAVTWDVQIPYHHGFRLTVQSPGSNIYFGVEWRPVMEAKELPIFKLTNNYTEQARAENRRYDEGSPWHDSAAIVRDRTDSITGPGTYPLADIDGPAMLQVLRFVPSTYDFTTLDSTWLNIYWDDAPTPSVHVPLLDFFASPNGVSKVRAFQLRASQDSGLTSYFPMPFSRRARIELVQMGSTPYGMHSQIQFSNEPIDRHSYGYFHADFSESNPTRYHVYHPVIRALGRGRYIGYSFGVMDHPPGPAVYLEGDPVFNVDSNSEYYLRYTGGEDYFDAGWWFADGLFTLPFAGFTHFVDAFYRFHYLDCYDFNSSFECDIQPGGNADIFDHFRTVGYYYLHWTSFWTNRDTLRVGEQWDINGNGYKPGEDIWVTFGDNTIAASADTSGAFAVSLTVPSVWKPGIYTLSVNGETLPRKIHILNGPSIRILHDTLPVTVVYRDSLTVVGTGFRPGERVQFYIDSVALDQEATADTNYRFRTVLHMPYLAEYRYLLVARGELSGNATAEDWINVSRTLYLECEDMMPPLSRSPGDCYAPNVSYFWMGRWGKQTFIYFKPDTITTGAYLELAFTVPRADTFHVDFHNSVGQDLGRYNILIDDSVVAQVDGFHVNTPDWWDPLPSGPISCGTHYLAEGSHRLKFVCIGKDDSARHYWIQPDFIVLKPVTDYPRPPGTLANDDAPISVGSAKASIYPNPLTGSTKPAQIQISIDGGTHSGVHARGYITIYDVLGEQRASFNAGAFTSGSLTADLPILPVGDYFVRADLLTETGLQHLPALLYQVK